ncbi:nucleoside hydrolase [Sphingobacterium mizutaii]|uniref:nucleoside hydrolase n=1 Tax=Sphingobacterium mizutaii TaxID=1010 RepID=UPI003D95D0C1
MRNQANFMLKTSIISFLFIFIAQYPVLSKTYPADSAKVKIIFDTDMGPDYDDIGAIALLHAFANQGKIEILATVSSDAHKDIPGTIEVYNKYFKRGDIPVGQTYSPLAPNFTAANNWNEQIIKKFEPTLLNKKYESSVSIYRKVLAEQPDNSVTIVTVGFMTNISDLLQSKADKYSNLTGMELLEKKVKNWVAMAGGFPQGREFNIHKDAESGVYAFDHFPKPILFSGFEIGDKIKTGGKIAEQKLESSPVSVGYQINLASYAKEAVKARSSWDQTAVLIAAENPEKYFYLSGPGTMKTEKDGSNYWEPSAQGKHKFIIHKYPYKKLEEVIDKLMLEQPK